MTPGRSPAGLIGRRDECRALDVLLEGAKAGHSAALVVRGEAGIGKSELLRYVAERTPEDRLVRAAGVQSEMELSYAGLQQLCSALLGGLDHLPGPQRDALATAFGLREGPAPDRFLVGLAVLSLLADAGGNQPLVCLVDDAQWLDRASALTLAFVARRLLAESVVLMFAVREPTPDETLTGLPSLLVEGLRDRDARTLLDSAVAGPLDQRVRDRIVAESRGNPLALLELPREWTAAELAGGFGEPDARPVPSQLEREFLRRVAAYPEQTRRLMLTAAAEPAGDVRVLRRAAERLGIDVEAASADAAELLTLGTRVHFRHPLVRSAVYRAASQAERQQAHRALAESLDAASDPDRRAWHRAQAAGGADEEVAAELERSAERAQARGGIAAVAAFLERAAELTDDPVRRSQRSVEAAQAKFRAGAFEPAASLLTAAAAGRPDDFTRARIDVLRAGIAFTQGRGKEAPALLLGAARRLEPLDVGVSREVYLEAVAAVIFAGHLARNPDWRDMGAAAREAPAAEQPRATDELLDALGVRLADGYAASVPMIERVLTTFSGDAVPVQESLRWLLLAGVIAADLWDLDRWHQVAARHVAIIREAGALSELPLALDSSAVTHVFAGELTTAAAVIEEVREISTAIGSNQPPFGALALAAVRGQEREARAIIDATILEAAPHGQGLGVTVAHYHDAVLCNGLARYDEAITAAQSAAIHPEEFGAPRWALAELVEAAVRTGATDVAADALGQLTTATAACETEWSLGIQARSQALLADDPEPFYRQAITHLSQTRVRVHLARTHLLYGEWLARQPRRVDAREHLTTAHEMLTGFGADAYAERAGRALHATGAKLRPRTATPTNALTSQESQIAHLAATGLTNAEIGTRLFLSPHTVDWHLRKIFSKLGITSRREIPTPA
ncbi:AAA family ATPase [Kribbella sp. NPDC051770]|uniref:helix-turn-helix transcriptional regulator n=1 Tax=Kribbella sp. NPDC051770 TaxID=3155413 RepID=UPI00342AA430